MEELSRCPACQSTHIGPYMQARDQLVSGKLFTLSVCRQCQLVFTHPRPAVDELAGFYESEDYISHTDRQHSLLERLYRAARTFTLRQKRRLIEKHRPPTGDKKLLDMGCGTGHFLQHCRQHGWQISGVEPNPEARKRAANLTGTRIAASLGEITGGPFTVITLWHVLEHVEDLNGTISHLYRMLTSGGLLVVAVPNHRAYDAAVFGEYWAAWDLPRHLYHFNRTSLIRLMHSRGFALKTIRPMWLDSYYISLLSNQYAHGSKKWLKSFITGSLSNIYAIKSGEFSSLVYLFSKSDAP